MQHNYFKHRFLLSFIFVFFLLSNSYSQCSERVTDFGNNTRIASYNIEGDVSVILNSDNTITLNLGSNFYTEDGPDVRAYLVNPNGLSDIELTNTRIGNLENFQIGLVSCTDCVPEIPAAGEKSFTVDIPNNVNIEEYNKVFFYCLAFNAFWDFGSFSAFTSSSCSVLSTEENAFTNVSISPNPATTTIQLSNIDSDNSEIRIFDFSGKKVFQQLKGTNQNTIDVSNLNTGIYVLSIIENNKQFSKKLIIQ